MVPAAQSYPSATAPRTSENVGCCNAHLTSILFRLRREVCATSHSTGVGVTLRAGVKPLTGDFSDEQDCHECPRRAVVL